MAHSSSGSPRAGLSNRSSGSPQAGLSHRSSGIPPLPGSTRRRTHRPGSTRRRTQPSINLQACSSARGSSSSSRSSTSRSIGHSRRRRPRRRPRDVLATPARPAWQPRGSRTFRRHHPGAKRAPRAGWLTLTCLAARQPGPPSGGSSRRPAAPRGSGAAARAAADAAARKRTAASRTVATRLPLAAARANAAASRRPPWHRLSPGSSRRSWAGLAAARAQAACTGRHLAARSPVSPRQRCLWHSHRGGPWLSRRQAFHSETAVSLPLLCCRTASCSAHLLGIGGQNVPRHELSSQSMWLLSRLPLPAPEQACPMRSLAPCPHSLPAASPGSACLLVHAAKLPILALQTA